MHNTIQWNLWSFVLNPSLRVKPLIGKNISSILLESIKLIKLTILSLAPAVDLQNVVMLCRRGSWCRSSLCQNIYIADANYNFPKLLLLISILGLTNPLGFKTWKVKYSIWKGIMQIKSKNPDVFSKFNDLEFQLEMATQYNSRMISG